MPQVSSADKKSSEEEIRVSPSLAFRDRSFSPSPAVLNEGGISGNYLPQLNTIYPSFSEVISRNGQHSSSARPTRRIFLNAAKETDFSHPVNSPRNVSKDPSSSAGTPFGVGSSANNGATREAATEQKKNKRGYYHGKRTHSRVYNSGKPSE